MSSVTVLLPVRDALPYLGASLASLWRQTLRDLTVIAVDDGSTDGSGELLEQAAAREPRLTVIHTPPRGLPAALNTALAAARAPFVARQDADDLSHRRRLELQLDFLRRHRSVAVVGSRLRLFPGAAVGQGMRRWADWHNALLSHRSMVREMLIDSPLAHGTAMFRRSWLRRVGGWADLPWPEDLDLWHRLIEAGARFGKRPEVLYGWRQHRRSATHWDPRYRPERFLRLKREVLERRFLKHAESLTLIGVGTSLERWRHALEQNWRVLVLSAGRPGRDALRTIRPPAVLVFGALPARQRWRHALIESGLSEGREFIFVA